MNSLFIGLGGVGKRKADKLMLVALTEPEKQNFLIVNCSDIKVTTLDSDKIHTEENANE